MFKVSNINYTLEKPLPRVNLIIKTEIFMNVEEYNDL